MVANKASQTGQIVSRGGCHRSVTRRSHGVSSSTRRAQSPQRRGRHHVGCDVRTIKEATTGGETLNGLRQRAARLAGLHVNGRPHLAGECTTTQPSSPPRPDPAGSRLPVLGASDRVFGPTSAHLAGESASGGGCVVRPPPRPIAIGLRRPQAGSKATLDLPLSFGESQPALRSGRGVKRSPTGHGRVRHPGRVVTTANVLVRRPVTSAGIPSS
jgi:hypothetical protein